MGIVDKARAIKSIMNAVKNRIARYVWTGALAAEYLILRELGRNGTLGTKPDLIVGGIPIYYVNREGHASSDEILKYRSIGGIFLAHQKGGKHTFKFTALLFGPQRFIIVKLLEGLLFYGTESLKKVMNLTKGGGIGSISWTDEEQGVLKTADLLGGPGAPLVEYSKHGDFENQEYAYHHTYPIITQSKIYTDMYMETFVTKESTKIGLRAIEVDCSFRQYLEPTHYQKSEASEEQKKKYYSAYVDPSQLAGMTFLDHAINLAWAYAQFKDTIETNRTEWLKYENDEIARDIYVLLGTYSVFGAYQAIKYGG